jgi:hypothetical protein
MLGPLLADRQQRRQHRYQQSRLITACMRGVLRMFLVL